MNRSFLSWFGLLALLGLFGAGMAGLMLVKDRLRIVVQDDSQADPGAQRIAELEDQLKQVHGDVRALAEALGKGLQQLADAQSQDGDARQQELAQKLDALALTTRTLTQDLGAVRSEQLGAGQALAGLKVAVQELTHKAGTAAATLAGPSATATPSREQPPSETPAVAQGAAPPKASETPSDVKPAPSGELASAKTEPPAAAPRKRGAFAFQLPSQQFRFDLAQGFELMPSLSRVGFDAKSTLHDFTGVTSKLQGRLRMNLAQPANGCSGEIRVDAASLDTGLADRNDAMREHLGTHDHKEIVFTFEAMTAEQVDVAGQKCQGTVRGKMTIRGQTRELTMPVRLSVDEARRVHADGEVMLKLSDYAVPVPSQLGLIKMQDEVKVWISLQARALGEEAKK